MTAFITHCWKSARLDFAALLWCMCLACALPSQVAAETVVAEVPQLLIDRKDDNIQLTAVVKFDLPTAVEDALLKGVPVIFVAGADVYRERWYWLDKKLVSVERHMRLVFHPLTRRWRLAVASGPITNSNLGVALNQTFDTLEDALGAIRRISGWRIAEIADIDAGGKYRLEFRFRLDVSQLPRPLQIGALGQSDWTLATVATQQLVLENLK
jgi:hypothetical protein